MRHARHYHQPALHRLVAAWLAVLLALFAALAPTVSHALALDRATQGIEICTSTGNVTSAPTIPADSPTGPESAKLMDHCPFCLLQADRVAPPPSPVAYLFLVQGGQQEVPAWQAFFFVPHFYSPATPRGPPLK
jgi:hypothetical protein